MFAMIAGMAAPPPNPSFLKVGAYAYVVNMSLLKDILDKMNVCDDWQCGCICHKRILFEGCP
jgi:hypothetical protein